MYSAAETKSLIKLFNKAICKEVPRYEGRIKALVLDKAPNPILLVHLGS